jgi:hypothetical protein
VPFGPGGRRRGRVQTNIEISRGPEPSSHLSANWIGLHNKAIDGSCSNCHDTANPGGTDNTSFCSNSACHGTAWTYAGLDAPGLADILASQLPTPMPAPTTVPVPTGGTPTYATNIQPIFESRCGACHGADSPSAGLTLTTYRLTLAGSENGPVIVPGDSPGSKLVEVQNGQHFGQLTAEELALVIEWIDAGAPEN